MTRCRVALLMVMTGVLLSACQQPPPTGALGSTATVPGSAVASSVPSASMTPGSTTPGSIAQVSTRPAGTAPSSMTSSKSSAPSCPAQLSVAGASPQPEPPVLGVADRLVPDTAARSALLCSYVGTNMEPARLKLAGTRTLTSDLTPLTQDLRWLPPRTKEQEVACTLVGGPQTNYLLALTSVDGSTAWVAGAQDPNGCVPTTNGRFVALPNMGAQFAATMKTGRWPGLASDDASCSAVGRYGQQSGLVPSGVVGVDICRSTADQPVTIHRQVAGFGSLVAALNLRHTRPSTSSCGMLNGEPEQMVSYSLRFRYASGPSSVVRVLDHCNPGIDNGSLQAADDGTVVRLIESLLSAKSPGAKPSR